MGGLDIKFKYLVWGIIQLLFIDVKASRSLSSVSFSQSVLSYKYSFSRSFLSWTIQTESAINYPNIGRCDSYDRMNWRLASETQNWSLNISCQCGDPTQPLLYWRNRTCVPQITQCYALTQRSLRFFEQRH